VICGYAKLWFCPGFVPGSLGTSPSWGYSVYLLFSSGWVPGPTRSVYVLAREASSSHHPPNPPFEGGGGKLRLTLSRPLLFYCLYTNIPVSLWPIMAKLIPQCPKTTPNVHMCTMIPQMRQQCPNLYNSVDMTPI